MIRDLARSYGVKFERVVVEIELEFRYLVLIVLQGVDHEKVEPIADQNLILSRTGQTMSLVVMTVVRNIRQRVKPISRV